MNKTFFLGQAYEPFGLDQKTETRALEHGLCLFYAECLFAGCVQLVHFFNQLVSAALLP